MYRFETLTGSKYKVEDGKLYRESDHFVLYATMTTEQYAEGVRILEVIIAPKVGAGAVFLLQGHEKLIHTSQVVKVDRDEGGQE